MSDLDITRKQMLKIAEGAKIIAEALDTSADDVFIALNDNGNITGDEMLILKYAILYEEDQ